MTDKLQCVVVIASALRKLAAQGKLAEALLSADALVTLCGDIGLQEQAEAVCLRSQLCERYRKEATS